MKFTLYLHIINYEACLATGNVNDSNRNRQMSFICH